MPKPRWQSVWIGAFVVALAAAAVAHGAEPLRPASAGNGTLQFTIAAGQTHRLEIGTPLTSTVTVKRRGSVLRLDYEMFDAGGWKYFPRGREGPPQVNIYQGDVLVGSGSFKYG
jgi:hypothetical protein